MENPISYIVYKYFSLVVELLEFCLNYTLWVFLNCVAIFIVFIR